jgi:hypothetical protein
LAIAYGADGYALVAAVYAPFSPPWLRELPAVETLRVMLIQATGASRRRRRGTPARQYPPGLPL